jgi:hypothetical protein
VKGLRSHFQQICNYQPFGEEIALVCSRAGMSKIQVCDIYSLTIKAPSTDAVRVFLPRRFTLIFSDVDIDMINDGIIQD